jgi:hypothetical protein
MSDEYRKAILDLPTIGAEIYVGAKIIAESSATAKLVSETATGSDVGIRNARKSGTIEGKGETATGSPPLSGKLKSAGNAEARRAMVVEEATDAQVEATIRSVPEHYASNKGTVTVEQSALDYAAKSKAEAVKLEELKKTSEKLAEQGYDVRILGEDPGQPGDIAIKGHGLASGVPAQAKRLRSNSKSAVRSNLNDGTAQAGNGGHTVLDGSGVGLSAEEFERGYQQFLYNLTKRTGKGKDGTITVILGDGSVITRSFP